jgi:DNA-binding response OmpR family regulator
MNSWTSAKGRRYVRFAAFAGFVANMSYNECGKTMVILVAEDDVHIQFLAWKLLKDAGFTVLKADNGEAALELSRIHPDIIDLLLVDVLMPRMGGLELCGTIAAERPDIKMLMMSSDLRNREQASMIGLPFLQKPFSPEALKDCIETLLGRAVFSWARGRRVI